MTLKKCKIKPFLIFDGTVDYKKINTIVTRTQDRLKTAIAWEVGEKNPTSNNKDCILEPHLAGIIHCD